MCKTLASSQGPEVWAAVWQVPYSGVTLGFYRFDLGHTDPVSGFTTASTSPLIRPLSRVS